MIEVPDASAGAPRLSRLRLHHAGAQPAPAGARGRDRPELRQPRPGQGRGVLPRVQRRRELRRLPAAIDDPAIDAVVVAVPPRFHLDLTLQALAAGKHVLVEKPAFLAHGGLPRRCSTARDRAGRVVLVGENDHYKPLAVALRRLLADGAIGEMVFAHFTTIAQRLKTRRRLAQRRSDGRRRRVLRGRHPLAAHRRQPRPADRRRSTATGRRCRARGRTGARRA